MRGAIAEAVRLACARTSGFGSSNKRSAQRNASPEAAARSARGLPPGRSATGHRSTQDVLSGQRSVLGQEPDGIEPHDAARVAEQRHEPRPRVRRQTVELGRDLHHVVGALYERLDEAVDRPLVALAKPAERSDARSAYIGLVAAQRPEQDRAGLVGLSVGEPDAFECAPWHLPVAVSGDRWNGATAPGLEPADEQRGDQQRPRAACDRTEDNQARSSVHRSRCRHPERVSAHPFGGAATECA